MSYWFTFDPKAIEAEGSDAEKQFDVRELPNEYVDGLDVSDWRDQGSILFRAFVGGYLKPEWVAEQHRVRGERAGEIARARQASVLSDDDLPF